MNVEDREDTAIYRAITNHGEHYNIRPADRPLPSGWNEAGKTHRKRDI